jgi:hypothetical protein
MQVLLVYARLQWEAAASVCRAHVEPLPRPCLGLVDPIRLSIIVDGHFVQGRRYIIHASAGRQAPALLREGAQRGRAVAHPVPVESGLRASAFTRVLRFEASLKS